LMLLAILHAAFFFLPTQTWCFFNPPLVPPTAFRTFFTPSEAAVLAFCSFLYRSWPLYRWLVMQFFPIFLAQGCPLSHLEFTPLTVMITRYQEFVLLHFSRGIPHPRHSPPLHSPSPGVGRMLFPSGKDSLYFACTFPLSFFSFSRNSEFGDPRLSQ